MNQIVLNAEMRSKLNSGTSPVEFTDEQGNVVGLFVTKEEFKQMQYAYAHAIFSQEDIAEARAEMLAEGGVSTAEVIEAIRAAKREWEARQ